MEVARGSLGCRTDTRFTPLALIGDDAFASSLKISQWLKSWKERRRTGRQLSTYLERMELMHHHSWQESSIVPKVTGKGLGRVGEEPLGVCDTGKGVGRIRE